MDGEACEVWRQLHSTDKWEVCPGSWLRPPWVLQPVMSPAARGQAGWPLRMSLRGPTWNSRKVQMWLWPCDCDHGLHIFYYCSAHPVHLQTHIRSSPGTWISLSLLFCFSKKVVQSLVMALNMRLVYFLEMCLPFLILENEWVCQVPFKVKAPYLALPS